MKKTKKINRTTCTLICLSVPNLTAQQNSTEKSIIRKEIAIQFGH